jgi:hypothetical protein
VSGTGGACHFSPAPTPAAIQAIDRFGERIRNAVRYGSFWTEAEVDAWGAGLIEARKQGPQATAQYLRERPMFGAVKVTVELAATGGAGLLRSGAAFREIRLAEGYYQAEGLPFRFSRYYYEKLWATGRGAPFLQAEEVLATGRMVGADRMTGFYRYTNDYLEMIYNPTTGEVWHIQPIR